MSRRLAGLFLAIIILAIWAFVEWRAQAPAPPAGKIPPWGAK